MTIILPAINRKRYFPSPPLPKNHTQHKARCFDADNALTKAQPCPDKEKINRNTTNKKHNKHTQPEQHVTKRTTLECSHTRSHPKTTKKDYIWLHKTPGQSHVVTCSHPKTHFFSQTKIKEEKTFPILGDYKWLQIRKPHLTSSYAPKKCSHHVVTM